MSLRVYLDRSELRKPARIVALSGYVSTVDRWDSFERDWLKLLKQHGVECFHMTDFETRHGVFQDWSNHRRLAFIKQAIGIIGRTTMVGIAAALNLSDYESLTPEDQEQLGHPYALLGVRVTRVMFDYMTDMNAVAKPFMRLRPGQKLVPKKIYVVFESGDEGAGELAALYEEVMSENSSMPMIRDVIMGYSFEDKATAVPLQAADLAAYEASHQVTRNLGVEERAIRQSLLALTKRVNHVGAFLNFEDLQSAARKRRAMRGNG